MDAVTLAELSILIQHSHIYTQAVLYSLVPTLEVNTVITIILVHVHGQDHNIPYYYEIFTVANNTTVFTRIQL